MGKHTPGQQCTATVFGDYNAHRCFNKSKVTVNGDPYCGIHDPVKKEKKEKERQDKWDKESREREKDHLLHEAAPDLLEACKVAHEYLKYNHGQELVHEYQPQYLSSFQKFPCEDFEFHNKL